MTRDKFLAARSILFLFLSFLFIIAISQITLRPSRVIYIKHGNIYIYIKDENIIKQQTNKVSFNRNFLSSSLHLNISPH